MMEGIRLWRKRRTHDVDLGGKANSTDNLVMGEKLICKR